MLTKKRIADWKGFLNADDLASKISQTLPLHSILFYLSHLDDPEMQWLNAKAYAQKFTANKSDLIQYSEQPISTSSKAKRKKKLKMAIFQVILQSSYNPPHKRVSISMTLPTLTFIYLIQHPI